MVKRFHGSRRFIFTGSWSATHVLLSFVGSELPRGLGAYVSPYLYSAINVQYVHTKTQNKNNTTTGRWSHRWSHPTGYLSSKILKLDDLYTFELSKCMFDCITCFLPTPILEHFRTNATTRPQEAVRPVRPWPYHFFLK